LAQIEQARERNRSSTMAEVEASRLLYAKAPSSEETEKQLRRLKAAVTSETRAYNFLGWHYYLQEDWAQSDKFFSQAAQKTKGHPQALIGQALTDLDRGLGLKERQKEIEESINRVFALP